ncbi:MAG TPA: phospholipase D-like domain-containing protein [Methanobacterium sp.]|nr:phospholipase D-like domain-containing protein [Methanobacterium sp.]
MGNIYKISGRLIDKNKKPLDDLKVKASRCSFLRDDKLGDSITDSDGAFEISYSDDHQNSSPEDIKLEISIENEPVKTISAKKEGLNLDFCTITIDANIGVEGRITNEHGDPISGLLVAAEDIDFGKVELNALNLIESKVKSFIKEEGILENSIGFIKDQYNLLFPFGDNFLGNTVTDSNGYYRIIYPPGKYKKIANKDPNIQIIVKDKLGIFELRRTEVYENVDDVIKCVNNIIINHEDMEGWFVTLKNGFKSRFTENNNFEILIDNEKTLQKIARVVEEAESYIYLTQFEFDSDFVPKFLLNDSNEFKCDDTLVYKLLEAQNRGTDVKIIINENAIIPDNYRELKNYFKESKVEVRNFPAKGPYAMHAKVLVADGEKAFIIGSPFNQSYWDTNKHLINESRRLNKDKGPLHDVSVYLEGDVTAHIEEFFIELWNYLSDQCSNGECKISKDIHLEEIKKSRKYFKFTRI